MKARSVIVSTALGIFICSISAAEPQPDQSVSASEIIIPRIEYLSTKPLQIFKQLERMSAQRDPGKRGVKIIVDDMLPTPAIQRTLTFTMNDTSVLNIAKHVANVAGLDVEAKKDGIYIHAPH